MTIEVIRKSDGSKQYHLILNDEQVETIDRALDCLWLDLNKDYKTKAEWEKKYIDENSSEVDNLQNEIEKAQKLAEQLKGDKEYD